MIAAGLGLLLFVYVLIVIGIWLAWVALPCGGQKNGRHSPTAFVSVLVAARNEANNLPALLSSLAAQNYPPHLLEVIIINDHSTDHTVSIVEDFAARTGSFNLRCISLPEAAKGKKAAIAAGINLARGTFICTTDADCVPQPGWVLQMVAAAEAHKAVFVSGPVKYISGSSLLSKLQAIEFSGLIAIGGATICLRQPTMCNGANLLFLREAFFAVNGYAGNEQIASGDDEFLLHKIAAAYPAGYFFNKNSEATVATTPKADVAGLMQQRIRWAGKWKHYQRNSPKVLAILVAAVYAGLLTGLFSALAGWLPWKYFVSFICVKFVVEALFFATILRFFNQLKLLWLVVVLQLVQPLFVLAVAFFTMRGRYNWKDRTVYAS